MTVSITDTLPGVFAVGGRAGTAGLGIFDLLFLVVPAGRVLAPAPLPRFFCRITRHFKLDVAAASQNH